jgi:hypothetical protein
MAASAGLPVAGSRRRSLIPDQNDPNAIHSRPCSSKTTSGSIALKSSAPGVERITMPSSVQP